MNPLIDLEQNEDRLLMSDSLKGMVPEIEDQIKSFEDSIIIVAIEYSAGDVRDVITGSVTGVSFEPDVIKLDFRKSTSEAYKFVKFCLFNPQAACNIIYFQNGADEFVINENFKMTSPKMTDLDYKEKTCTLSLDLVKISI